MQFTVLGYTIRISAKFDAPSAVSKIPGIDLVKSDEAVEARYHWADRIFNPTVIAASGSVEVIMDPNKNAPIGIISGKPGDLVVGFTEDDGERKLSLNIKDAGRSVKLRLGAEACQRIEVSGSADLTASELDQSSLKIFATGSPGVFLTGAVSRLEIGASGSADIHARELKATELDIYGVGSSDIEAHVTGYLKAVLDDSADLDFWGKPKSVHYTKSRSSGFKRR